jgi:hypothetical protein
MSVYGAPAPAAFAAPAMRVAPPLLSWRKWTAVAALGLMVLAALSGVWLAARPSSPWRGRLLFAGQMALLTAALCLTPTLAYHLTKRWRRAARVVLETWLFTSVFVLFYLWLWGDEGLGEWLRYAVGLLLLIEVGSNLVERHKLKTIERLRGSKLFVNLRPDAETLERMFRHELAIYVPVPCGLVIGTVWGLARGWPPQATVSFSVQIVLWLTSLVILYFLVKGFARMSDSLFKDSDLPPTQVVTPPKAKRLRGGKKFRLSASVKASTREGRRRKVLDLAVTIADLRKVYLYDSAHNVALLIAFTAVALKLQGVGIDEKTLLLLLLLFSFGLNHLPYIIGQSRLHEKVLEPYYGVERAEINAKLKEHAPYFPRWEFLAVLLTSSPAGGVVYFLLEHSVHDVLK